VSCAFHLIGVSTSLASKPAIGLAALVGGAGAPEMTMDRGVGPWIERRARIAPNQAALIHGEWRCTYSELANRIRRLAQGFVGVTGRATCSS
jgi:hypothetical protein